MPHTLTACRAGQRSYLLDLMRENAKKENGDLVYTLPLD